MSLSAQQPRPWQTARMRSICCLALLLAILSLPDHAMAEVRRCVAADGSILYTDRSCEYHNALPYAVEPERAATATSAAPAVAGELPLASFGPVNQDCARTPDLLVSALQHSLRTHDINGLSGLYHWPRIGKWSARTVMDRLERLDAHATGTPELVYPAAAFVVFNPAAWPDLPPEDPIGIRVPLLDIEAATPVEPEGTDLRVIRHAGCWWVYF